jgi:hypothetical protein
MARGWTSKILLNVSASIGVSSPVATCAEIPGRFPDFTCCVGCWVRAGTIHSRQSFKRASYPGREPDGGAAEPFGIACKQRLDQKTCSGCAARLPAAGIAAGALAPATFTAGRGNASEESVSGASIGTSVQEPQIATALGLRTRGAGLESSTTFDRNSSRRFHRPAEYRYQPRRA